MVKKLFLAAAVAAFGITSCQKADVNDFAAGSESSVTVSATMPTEMYGTRSGEGNEVNRCIMEIYLNGVRYGEPAVAVLNGQKAQFSARLISGKTYDLVFWADAADGTTAEDFADKHYNTASLTNVTVKDVAAYAGNDETRDAFFATEKLFVEMSTSVNVELRRPFGQLNVKTNDMQEVRDANIASLIPSHVSVAFKAVPTGINLLTGELTAASEAVVYAEKSAVVDDNGTFSMDYIFAPKGEGQQFLADFTMSFFNAEGGEAAADYEFSNIPVQRNYRTNVSGNLLTKKADIKVEVKPEFKDEEGNDQVIDHEIKEVTTIEEANEALAAGGKVVVAAAIDKIDLTAAAPLKPLTLVIKEPVGELVLGTQAENPEKTTIEVKKDVAYPAFSVANGIAIRNVEIKGDPQSSEGCAGLTIFDKGVPVVDGLTFSGVRFDGHGVNLSYPANPQITKNVVFDKCVAVDLEDHFFIVSHNRYAGTEVGDITIRNCKISFAAGASELISGIDMRFLTGGTVLVENCEIVNAPKHGIMISYFEGNAIVRKNTITDCFEDGVKSDEVKGSLLVEENTIKAKEFGVRVARFTAAATPSITIINNNFDMTSVKNAANFNAISLAGSSSQAASAVLVIEGNKKVAGNVDNWYSINSSLLTAAEGSNTEAPFAEAE